MYQFTLLRSLLLIVTLFAGFVFAQSTHTIDFEPGGVGADWNWVVVENADNPAMEFVANPSASGINTSATVAKFTARADGNPWALCFTDDDGEFTFDADNAIVKIMVYKSLISPITVKFEGTSGSIELQDSNNVVNEWEEITFDFSSSIGNTYNRLVIIPDFKARTQDNIVYFDNVQVPDGMVAGPLPEPTDPAPTPNHASANVLSIFSDAYMNLAGVDFNPNWGQSTIVTVNYPIVPGDSVLKYENLNYQGTQLPGNTDVSGYDYIHLDYWTPNSTALNFYLISEGPQETPYALPIATEQWVSVDIPLSAFTPTVDLANIIQFKVDGNGTVYFDNIYFYKTDSSGNEPTSPAPTPSQDAANVISLFSNAYSNVTVDTWSAVWDQADVADVQVAGDDVKLYTNLIYAGIEFTSQTIDASAMDHFHMDIWTPDATDLPNVFKIKLVDFGADDAYGGGDDVEHEVTIDANSGLVTGSWVSLDLALSDFTNLTTKEHLAQLIISGDLNTVYVDNIYFYKTGTAIDEFNQTLPGQFVLEQNYPNPFNPETNIRFAIKEAGMVSLKVFNLKGQTVATLIEGYQKAGNYDIVFDAGHLPSGTYFYQLTSGHKTMVKKMLLIK